jgi:tetratricopeptide (TPR) repeat protein
MAVETHRLKELFAAASELAPPERAGFLGRECGDDEELRWRVETLLYAHDASSSYLIEPPPAPADETGGFTPDPRGPGAQPPTLDYGPEHAPGAVIAGRYTLVNKIGEGGMGEVWVARQSEPVKRKVALKIIKPGMDSRQVVARFELERQALALMDHPNIARVLDGGLTPAGQPYFVMELVNGLPLTRYCDELRLTPRERLELFVPVCQAVQHAHQKGVIHRDLKPSNILVTVVDGKGLPKVIDFGVAKATSGKLTDETMSTQFGSVVGTLEYMAPEQAGLSGQDVDTRADIYSLGVLLYELLTGLKPHDGRRLRQAALSEMLRIIQEEEPSKPSTRLSTEASLPSLASSRRTEPRRLTAMLRGELDWVVMKCLEKQRDRRYETANGLTRDIQRYLADQPVEARPPSLGYRAGKFLRRNRGPVLAAAVVAAALVLGTVVATWQAVRATRAESRALTERDAKDRARAEAVAERKKAVDLADRLRESIAAVGQANMYTQQRRWSSAYAAFARAQELNPDLPQIYLFRRWMYEDLGLWERAADDGARYMALAEGGGWWAINWYQYALLRLHIGDEDGYLGACRRMLRRFDSWTGAEALYTVRACALAPSPVLDPAGFARQANHIDNYNVYWQLYIAGLAHYRAGQYDQAVDRLNASLAREPSWPARAINYPALAMAYHRLGKAAEARQALDSAEKAIDGWTEAMYQGPVGGMPIPWTDWLECRLLYREAKRLITGSAPPSDPRLRAIQDRTLAALTAEDAASLLDQGRSHLARGEWDAAASAYSQALGLLPNELDPWSKASAACLEIVRSPEVFARAVERRPRDARLWFARGRSLARRKQWGPAAADFARVMDARPPDDSGMLEYASLRLLAGDPAGYRRLCTRLVERYDDTSDLDRAYALSRVCTLAPGAVADAGRPIAWAELWTTRRPPFAWTAHAIGAAKYRADQFDEAILHLQESQKLDPTWPGHCMNDAFLALAHARLGQADEARRWRDEVDRWLAVADQQFAGEPSGFPPKLYPADWLIVQVLRRELDRVLAGPPGKEETP